MNPTLQDALDLARSSDERGFSAIYAALAAGVTRYAHSRRVEDPQQMTNDVFLAAFRNLHRFDGTAEQLRGWVYTIARNKAIDEARRRGRRPVVVDALVPEGSAPAAEADALRMMEPEWIEQELADLTPEQREVLMLRLVAGLTVAEVAQAIGSEIGAVKALQRRGIRRLQKGFSADPYPSGQNER